MLFRQPTLRNFSLSVFGHRSKSSALRKTIMAELGLLSSLVWPVSSHWALQSPQGILKFCDAYRSSHDDIRGMCKSIEALGKALVAILTLMNGKLISTAILEIIATSIFFLPRWHQTLAEETRQGQNGLHQMAHGERL